MVALRRLQPIRQGFPLWYHELRVAFYWLLIPFIVIVSACSKPVLKMARPLPPIVTEYKHVTLYGNRPGMINTQVYLNEGQLYSILATGTIDTWPSGPRRHVVRPGSDRFIARIGHTKYFYATLWDANASTMKAHESGNLHLGLIDGPLNKYGEPLNPGFYKDNSGHFSVDIILWKKADYAQIGDFLETMKEENPANRAIIDALAEANLYKEILLAKTRTSQEIEETGKQLQELKLEAPELGAQHALTYEELFVAFEKIVKESEEKPSQQGKPSTAELGKQQGLVELEEKLAKRTETLARLAELKKRFDQERKRTGRLEKELAEKEQREKDLLARLKDGPNAPPLILVAMPEDGSTVETNAVRLSGVAEDDRGLEQLEILINNTLFERAQGRGLAVTKEEHRKRLPFKERIPLEPGQNRITVRAVDSDGLSAEQVIIVYKSEMRRNVWAVVVGINNYPHVRKLHYAVNDAKAFYQHLIQHSKIPHENVTLLLNEEANLTRLRSTFGTQLKNKAGKGDMVILYFAGHGATEKDMLSPDGDGLEKYLLPFNADPQDLYATALPMGEISRIFNRIRAERLVFIVDSCYSGASGGRTISLTGIRATISDAFLDRISSGKGRVILTASGANEVSCENDKLKHGVFTYYLLEGLSGKADNDDDGAVTVDEAYLYVTKRVPRATNQEQHPGKKGAVEGSLILSVID